MSGIPTCIAAPPSVFRAGLVQVLDAAKQTRPSLLDGIVPAVSQAPFFINSARWIRAVSTNHLEETRIEPGPDGQYGICGQVSI